MIYQYLTLENTIYVTGVLLLLVIILLIWNIRLEIKTKKLMRGKNGNSLEDSFKDMNVDISDLQNFRAEMEKYLAVVEMRLKRSVQGVENINFNAFKGLESGGSSFATAFLNENGDGVILSSLHARERVSVFAKQVRKFKADMELTEEEEEALKVAREKLV